MTVVDFHIHPAKYQWLQPWVIKHIEAMRQQSIDEFVEQMASPDALVAMLRRNGVDYGVVFGEMSPITTGTLSNREVAEFCREFDCLIPFANINPHLVHRPAKELERLVNESGFRGLKLCPTYHHYYPNESAIYPIYAKAEELQIPVLIHTGSSIFRGARIKFGDPLFLDDIAVDFPDLVLVQVHGGRGFWYDRAFFLARLHSNLYIDVTGLPPRKLLDYFPELERIADKVIFGSDWPCVPSIWENISAVRDLPISEDAKKSILGKNAVRILGIPSRAGVEGEGPPEATSSAEDISLQIIRGAENRALANVRTDSRHSAKSQK